jgi:hypothetical protein
MQERIRGQNVFQRKIFTQQVPVNWKHTEVIAIKFLISVAICISFIKFP